MPDALGVTGLSSGRDGHARARTHTVDCVSSVVYPERICETQGIRRIRPYPADIRDITISGGYACGYVKIGRFLSVRRGFLKVTRG